MDYYRRYVGDYLADTQGLSMTEDGAYGRLLDYYYAKEGPLPREVDAIYRIARATTAAERKATASVLYQHFELRSTGYHNARADRELGVAVPKIEKLRANARENGKKGGNPKKKAQYNEPGALYAVRVDADRIKIGITKHLAQRVSGLRSQHGNGPAFALLLAVSVEDMGAAEAAILFEFADAAEGEMLMRLDDDRMASLRASMLAFGPEITQPKPAANPQPISGANPQPIPPPRRAEIRKQPPSANHHPTTNPLSDHRFPGDGDIPPPEPKAEAAKPQVKPDALARIVAECKLAKVHDLDEGMAIVERWHRNGATPTQVAAALTDARRSVQLPKRLTLGYVDTILVGILEADARARSEAAAKLKRTQDQLAEQATWTASDPPEGLMKQFSKRFGTAQ